MTRVKYQDLYNFCHTSLKAAGLDDYSAWAVANGLCETSLRGIDSHGVRLLPHYLRSAATGRKNPRPDMKFFQTFPAMGVLEADNAFGHAAGMKAIERAVEMAAEYGLGAVGVRNSSHPGAMAGFALWAARRGFMAFAFTHADSLLLSHGGTRPYFGTNPVCFAAPRQGTEPFCLDMATSIIPWNALLKMAAQGESLPPDVAADEGGDMTRDPAEARCLLPTGSYKGYGLAAMVEVLCGVFTGMAFGRSIPAMYKAPMDQPRHLGQFYLALRTDGCVESSQFEAALAAMTAEVQAEPARDGERVILPGDREIAVSRERLENGIPLDEALRRELVEIAAQLETPLPLAA